MKKFLPLFFIPIFLLLPFLFFQSSYAKTIDEELAEIDQALANLEKAMAPLKEEQTDLAGKIKSTQKQIGGISLQITGLTTRLVDREADLEVQKLLLQERVRRLWINKHRLHPWLFLLSSQSSSNFLHQYTWYQSVINQDQASVQTLGQEIGELITQKTRLKKEQGRLAVLEETFEKRSEFLGGEIEKAEEYKAELSSRQKELIAQKTALFSTSVGDASTSQDPASRADYDPGFRPAFALFSFGAPHRKGMSQFGALGRSQAGQNHEAILKAYYGDIRLETVDMPGSIATSVGSLPFEDNYLLGIAEMPSSWGDKGGMEALKAQAIAARTYALSYVGWRMGNRNASGSICTSEACQVYSSSKASSVPDTWRRAVSETRGKVVVGNSTNEIMSTWYASTSGGYQYSYNSLGHNTPGIWDTACGSQSCWPQDAWEKKSESPWFYKGWYQTRGGQSCARSHPWLTQDEFADIINAVIVYSADKGLIGHLSQIDSGGCWGGVDPDAWSKERLREETNRFGGPVTSISGVTVDYSTGGYTAQVHLQTNRGSLTFSGEDFKEIFTLRAPGAIHLKSLLFNIEKK